MQGAKNLARTGRYGARGSVETARDKTTHAADRQLAAVIPDHELLCLIGKGSYGEVWLARSALGAHRAIKIVYQNTFRDRRPFERELTGVRRFEPVSRLHEGLMDVLQVGRNEEAGYFYCVMELADDLQRGTDIDPKCYTPRTLARDLGQQKRLPFETCVQVGLAMTSALAFLHHRGLIHRDVKPSNIVYVHGVLKLADIGLVAEMSEARSYVGTEGFIPPEGPGSVRADLYSLGKVLYEISTGKDRYEYPELPTLLEDTEHDRHLIALNKVILRACRSEPRQRYRSAEEMHQALQNLRHVDHHRRTVIRSKFLVVPRIACLALMLSLVAVLLGKWHRAGQALGRQGPTTSPVSMPQGLVALWRAEGNGLDQIGATEPAQLIAVSYAPGKVGRAFSFDGLTSEITVPASTNLALRSFSIETWLFPLDTSLERPIVEYAAPTGHLSVQFWYNEAVVPGGGARVPGALYALLRGQDGSALQVGTEPGLIPDHQWTHVGLTFDCTNRTVLLYVNGVNRGSNSSSTAIAPNMHVPVHLGCRPERSGELWAGRRHLGLLDEVSIYNRALSAREMRSIYAAGGAGKQVPDLQGAGADGPIPK